MSKLAYLFLFLGVMSLVNGSWMLFSAETWYEYLPAAIPDTGMFNGHLIRDLGLVYALSGGGFVWSAFQLSRAYPVMIGQAVFYGGHALLHVIDILLGRLPESHWIEDALGVFLPGILVTAIATPALWRRLVSGPSLE